MPEDMTFKVVTFREGDWYVAQALEVDVCAQGRSAEAAMRNLRAALNAEAQEAESTGRSLMDIGPAPRPFHVMYYNHDIGRDTTKVA